MIKIGEWNHLEVVKEKDFGIYLAEKKYDDEEVLLPKKQVPAGTRMGDQLDVFIYRDSADRLIATTNHDHNDGRTCSIKMCQCDRHRCIYGLGTGKRYPASF